MSDTPRTDACEKIATRRHGYYDRFAIARELERELVDLKESVASFSHPNCRDLLRELAEAREQRDSLAEALKETISSYDVVTESIPSLCSDYVHNVIDPLLAAVKGGTHE
jgi:hypothetical protein